MAVMVILLRNPQPESKLLRYSTFFHQHFPRKFNIEHRMFLSASLCNSSYADIQEGNEGYEQEALDTDVFIIVRKYVSCVLRCFGKTFTGNKVLIRMFTQDIVLSLVHEPSTVLLLYVMRGSHKG